MDGSVGCWVVGSGGGRVDGLGGGLGHLQRLIRALHANGPQHCLLSEHCLWKNEYPNTINHSRNEGSGPLSIVNRPAKGNKVGPILL